MGVEIYSLLCPFTLEVKYIGKANNSIKRLKSHIRDSRTRSTPVYEWIKNLSKLNKTPIMNVLCLTNIEEWSSIEKSLISDYKSFGCNLLNVAVGGKEPFCSKEQRAINGKNNAKKIHLDPKSKRMWQLKHVLAINLSYLEKIGRIEKVLQIKEKLLTKGIYA